MRVIVIALLGCLTGSVMASEEALERFNRITADPQLREQAYASGAERVRFCSYCHGETGNSKRAYIPNLAQQSPIYLFNAFEKFANGQRSDFVMSKLAKTLTLEERVDIAVYFSQQQVKAPKEPVDPALLQQGQAMFSRICVACHGAQGEGQESMPRLAGQPAEYVRKALTRFRDKDPSRAGSVMMTIAEKFTDQEINALASFLQQLEP